MCSAIANRLSLPGVSLGAADATMCASIAVHCDCRLVTDAIAKSRHIMSDETTTAHASMTLLLALRSSSARDIVSQWHDIGLPNGRQRKI